MKFFKFIFEGLKLPPPYLLFFMNLFFSLLFIPNTFPLILILLVSMGMNLYFFKDKVPFIFPLIFPIFLGFLSAASQLLGRLNLHGQSMSLFFLFSLVTFSLFNIFKFRKSAYLELKRSLAARKTGYLISNLCLISVVSCYWFYSHNAWHFYSFNSTPAHYIQMSQRLLTEGSFQFLPPTNDLPSFYNWWYPNLLAHLITVFGSPLGAKGITRFAPYLGSFVTWWGLGSLYFFVSSKTKEFTLLTGLLIALVTSYAFFNLHGAEFGSDTPMYLFLPAFFYFCSHNSNQKLKYQWHFACLTALFAFWFRFNVGIVLTLTFLFLNLLKTTRISAIRKEASLLSKFSVPIIGLIIISFWYVDVYQTTGNPLHPYWSNAQTSLQKYIPLRHDYQISFDSTHSPDPNQHQQNETGFSGSSSIFETFLYHFFAIPLASEKRTPLKVIRGFLHGFTYSSLITLTATMGCFLFLFFSNKNEPFTEILRLSFLVLVSAVLLFSLGGIHHKFFFMLFCPLIILSFHTLNKFFPDRLPWVNSVFILPLLFSIVFILSFLMKGVGSQADSWAVLKCFSTTVQPCPYVKDYGDYELAQKLETRLKKNQKILFFHVEPGFQLNYYLGRRPFYEEYSYQSIDTSELHCTKTAKGVLSWLTRHQIGAISSTYSAKVDHYIQKATVDCPELLPKMIKEKSILFSWMGESLALVPQVDSEVKTP